MAKSRLHQLSALGQSVWIDYLSRDLLASGELERMMRRRRRRRRHLEPDDLPEGDRRRATPTTSSCAEAAGETRDAEGALHRRSPSTDVGNACDLLRPVWDEGSGRDGYVSMEVDPTPRLRHARPRRPRRSACTSSSTGRTCSSRSRPRSPGLPAIEDMIAKGKSINVTLIFSLERYAGGRRGLHPRPGAARAARRRPRDASPRWRASSSRASTPRPTAGWTSSAATTT